MRNKDNNLKKYAKEIFLIILKTLLLKLLNLRHFIKTNKKSEVTPQLKFIKENDEVTLAFSDVETANLLNDYFASISTLNKVNATLPTFSLKTQNSLNNIQI